MTTRSIWLHLGALGVLLALLTIFYVANTGARAVPGLIEDLQSGDVQRQVLAAEGLKAIGPDAKDAVEPLVAAASSAASSSLNTAAAGALAAIDLSAARRVMHAWLPKLQDSDTQVRRDAASALGALGPSARPAVPALVTILNDPDLLVRDRATRALGSIGIPIDQVTQGLMRALRDQEWQVRHAAVMQFAFSGFSNREALLMLRELIEDANPSVAQLARSAIADAERESRTETYVLMLHQNMSRPFALHQLAKLGPRAADAIPTLTTVLTSQLPLERYLALCALEAIGPQALPSITQALNDTDPVVKDTAADALRSLKGRTERTS